MRKNKKGFTLIELIAVLVILAIIALIVTPLVMNIVKKAKDSANKRSVDAYGKAVELAVATYLLDNGDYPTTLDDLTVEYTGNEVVCNIKTLNGDGSIYLSQCSVKGAEVKDSNAEDGWYHYGVLNSNEAITKVYADGVAIYYNPETNKVCTLKEASNNVNSNGTSTGVKNGCMKWYVFNYVEDSGTVNLILDHNTTSLVMYNSNQDSNIMLEAKEALERDISAWNEDVKTTARLISAEEVAQITKNTTFDVTKNSFMEIFYFDTNSTSEDPLINAVGLSKFAWLFDNLSGCTSKGCNIEDNNNYNSYDSNSTGQVYGYWTSSAVVSSPFVWSIGWSGCLGNSNADAGVSNGVRPVINISKTNL